MGSPESASIGPGWQKRLTYVTTTGLNPTSRNGSVGTIIGAERLLGVRVRCPRCDAAAATIWRRFDYLGRDLPLYFTKCRRCHRRRPIGSDEAAFRLLEAGVIDPMAIVQHGIPTPVEGSEHDDGRHHPSGGDDALSVTAAEELMTNRRRALGKRHPLTFDARAQLGEAVGRSGDAQEAAQMFEQLVNDQLAAVGRQAPAVMANRYRAAVWTAHAGNPAEALTALRGLLVDEEASLGAEHANTLITRATIAQLIEETGDRDEAIEMLRQVHRDQLRLRGSEDPATEASQRLLAEWEGR